MRRVATRMALVAALASILVSGVSSRLATTVVAQEAGGAGPIEVRHPWLRATPKGAPVVNGLATIINKGATTDRLIGASPPVASEARVHAMTNADGVMHMARTCPAPCPSRPAPR